MAAETKSYIIPLRRSFQQAAPMKRTPKALRAVKAYIIKHCKVEDVKIGDKLNALIWENGITNPPAKVAVDVTIDGSVAKAELQGHAYKEAAKIQKKQAPESLKEKIASKIGVDKKDADKEEPAAKKEEEPAEETKKASEQKPEAAPTEDKKE